MLGQFQHSSLRLEVEATEAAIAQSLTQKDDLQKWLFPQQLDAEMPAQLKVGDRFTNQLGPIRVTHEVDICNETSLRLLLSEGIDGFHEWHWGEGWVQSRLEGISVLPLNLGLTLALWRLRLHLAQTKSQAAADSSE
ncbi:MAG: hypothetical protein F6J87_22290 [Spirulina sp. SIO3F2]|nr:hypothetical protein [Spirulina sp. SIO3F2]